MVLSLTNKQTNQSHHFEPEAAPGGKQLGSSHRTTQIFGPRICQQPSYGCHGEPADCCYVAVTAKLLKFRVWGSDSVTGLSKIVPVVEMDVARVD